MSGATAFTLRKRERLNSMTLIGRLFNEPGSRSITVFPVRAIYKTVETDDGEPAVRVLISVPKRKLHHAVDRNRVKRQLREAYRNRKQQLIETVESTDNRQLLLAFVWLDEEVKTTAEVKKCSERLINRIIESL